jgi:lipopolysaccharide/colanic/teichoic acid biosynthesis glycosyltransferase
MLGALISNWTDRIPRVVNDPLLITPGQFNREIARERIRATRRSIPFCILTIELDSGRQRRRRARVLCRLLHRHIRVTDLKARLGAHKFAVLLVDTPEMGGRVVLDRLTDLAERHNLQARMNLRVHDPDGFGGDDDFTRTDRRRTDEASTHWLRVESAEVQVSTEDPLVPRPYLRMSIKRAVDIVGATTGLVVLSPLIVGGMLAVKFGSRGPALFTQTREGLRGKPFTIYKLRTMVVDAEAKQQSLHADSHRDGPAFKVKQDPRVTKIGKLLRATCIDELPQLVNVLKGDMSLVGPRPLPWHESRACNGWHRRRLDVRPGMTCEWQVNKHKATTFDQWMRMDLRYIDEIGLLKDLSLIAQTVTVPILGRGSD